MRLLLTLDFPPERGGIQRYLHDKVLHGFGSCDHVAVGIERRRQIPMGGIPCKVTVHGNWLSRFNKKWSVVNFFFLLLAIRRNLCGTTIECGNLYAAAAPWLLSFFLPLRYRVYTYGGELLAVKRPTLRGILYRHILRRAAELSVLGEFGNRLLRDAKIATPTVIDPPRITLSRESEASSRRAFRAPDGKGTLRILSVGRLVPHKGHALLVKACSMLPRDLSWSLLVAGRGTEEKRLVSLSRELGCGERVTIATDLGDEAMGEEYRQADLFVLPSIETSDGVEGFGIVLLEAMAVRCAVIACRTGGIPEVLDDGHCGLLVAPGDVGALREAILSCIADPEARLRRIEAALTRVRERYAWN